MAKKVFQDGQGFVSATDLNGWETVRVDLFDEQTTKAGALAALGGVGPVHEHTVAVPSINGIGGSAGFISAADRERLQTAAAYPASLSSTVPDNYAIAFRSPSGAAIGITWADLIAAIADQIGTVPGGGGDPTTLDLGEVGGDGPVGVSFDGGEIGGLGGESFDGGEIV